MQIVKATCVFSEDAPRVQKAVPNCSASSRIEGDKAGTGDGATMVQTIARLVYAWDTNKERFL